MPGGSWRDSAKVYIGGAFAEARRSGMTTEEFAAMLFHIYPWGPREMYPYKVWCEECRKARALYAAQRGETKPYDPAEAGDGLFAEAEA